LFPFVSASFISVFLMRADVTLRLITNSDLLLGESTWTPIVVVRISRNGNTMAEKTSIRNGRYSLSLTRNRTMNGLRDAGLQHRTSGLQSVGPRLAAHFLYVCDEVRWHPLESILKALEVLLDFTVVASGPMSFIGIAGHDPTVLPQRSRSLSWQCLQLGRAPVLSPCKMRERHFRPGALCVRDGITLDLLGLQGTQVCGLENPRTHGNRRLMFRILGKCAPSQRPRKKSSPCA
jgi:hypothetical protein